jgi:hypothetical protein
MTNHRSPFNSKLWDGLDVVDTNDAKYLASKQSLKSVGFLSIDEIVSFVVLLKLLELRPEPC